MSFVVFAVFSFVLLLAAYTVVRARYRRFTCWDLAWHLKPHSPETRRLLSQGRWEPCPPTWLPVAELLRAQQNSSVLTQLIDRYKCAMSQCTDPDDAADMHLTYRTAIKEREVLLKSMLRLAVNFCFGRIAWGTRNPYMARFAQHYTNMAMLVGEMLELMDGSAASLMEDNFFHGS